MSNRPIRVLVVDDSALVRKAITDSLAHDPEIQVVGTAIDPYVARDKILQLNPDVLTLDIEMPRMDGITFLKVLMKHRPIPVVILSSLTSEGSAKALEALQYGAVDVLCKPSGSMSSLEDGAKLALKIKAAAQAHLKPCVIPDTPSAAPAPLAAQKTALSPAQRVTPAAPVTSRSVAATVAAPRLLSSGRQYTSRHLILLGASTGGTEALKTILTALPADMPGICIVQHIPAYFSLAFANRLNDLCAFEVREARHGDAIKPGLALIAPGGHHVIIKWDGAGYKVDLNDGPMVHHQRPAVDVMFDSAVKAGAAPYSMAALLTGMGADGAAGLLKLREAGSRTVAQDEASCVVFGMPREAIKMGAAQQVLPLSQIAMRLDRHAAEVALKLSA